MIGKQKKIKDIGERFGALLTDLSKDFDSFPPELTIMLRLGFDYLSTRKQNIKISNTYSSKSGISYDTARKMKFFVKDCFSK